MFFYLRRRSFFSGLPVFPLFLLGHQLFHLVSELPLLFVGRWCINDYHFCNAFPSTVLRAFLPDSSNYSSALSCVGSIWLACPLASSHVFEAFLLSFASSFSFPMGVILAPSPLSLSFLWPLGTPSILVPVRSSLSVL